MREVEEYWIGQAMELARHAEASGDVPVGALVVDPQRDSAAQRALEAVRGWGDGGIVPAGCGVVLGEGWNTRELDNDPAGHAEIMALRGAARERGSWRLEGCDLYVTLEPCTMCAGAIVAARLRRVVFGAWDPKAGAAGSVRDVLRDSRLNHQTQVVGGIRDAECARQLRSFFGR
ncbi:nucleoside deaminase [Actinomycetaceae bacterium L2_0104]